jgi:hypothetical protein
MPAHGLVRTSQALQDFREIPKGSFICISHHLGMKTLYVFAIFVVTKCDEFWSMLMLSWIILIQ